MNNGTEKAPLLPDELWKNFMGQHLNKQQRHEGVYENHVRHNILDRKNEPVNGHFTYFLGHSGQILYLMPEKKLVVIRFGEKTQLLHSTLYATWRSMIKNN